MKVTSPLLIMRVLVICVIALCFPALALADGLFDGDWYFKANAEGPRVSVFLQDTTFAGTTAELHLSQSGTAVSGTWRISGKTEVLAGSLKGIVQGDTLQIYLCSDVAGEEAGTAVCPDYPVEFDYLVNHGTWMAWYKNKQSGFEKYLALERHANDIHAKQQEK